ncbi:MAG: ATP synthase subunit C [Caldilineaceae bacterium]
MRPIRLAKLLIRGLLTLNITVALAALGVAALLWLSLPGLALAAPLIQASGVTQDVSLGAALAIGLAAIGAGIAVGVSGAAAIGAMAEKPEILGRALIVVGLAEGIAIYGLIISFMILTR